MRDTKISHLPLITCLPQSHSSSLQILTPQESPLPALNLWCKDRNGDSNWTPGFSVSSPGICLQASWVEAQGEPHWRQCRSSASCSGKEGRCRQDCPRLCSPGFVAPDSWGFPYYSWGQEVETCHHRCPLSQETQGQRPRLTLVAESPGSIV